MFKPEQIGSKKEDIDKNSHKKPDDKKTHDCDQQKHTHEFLGSVKIVSEHKEHHEEAHNHRFAGVSGEAITEGKSHVHCLKANTDFYENHFHVIADKTGPAISVGDGRHVHFVEGKTTTNDRHKHKFELAVLINNPIGD